MSPAAHSPRICTKAQKIWAATIIFLTVLVMIFCLQGLYQMVFLHSKPVLYAFTAGMVGFLATSVGSLPGFF